MCAKCENPCHHSRPRTATVSTKIPCQYLRTSHRHNAKKLLKAAGLVWFERFSHSPTTISNMFSERSRKLHPLHLANSDASILHQPDHSTPTLLVYFLPMNWSHTSPVVLPIRQQAPSSLSPHHTGKCRFDLWTQKALCTHVQHRLAQHL